MSRLTGAALCAMLLTGCSATPANERPASPAAPGVGAAAPVDAKTQIHLPFDDFELSPKEDALVMRAYLRVVRRCAVRFGVESTLTPSVNPSSADLNRRRYGITDEDEARQYGYSPPQAAATPDDREWNPTPIEFAVVTGPAGGHGPQPTDSSGHPVPRGGCSAEAERALGGSAPVDVAKLSLTSFANAEGDPRVRAAVQQWSDCMRRAGLEYDSPWDPNDTRWPDPPGQVEKTTAVADVDCRRETNLAGIWSAVESAYQREAIGAAHTQFEGLASWRRQRVDRARAILAGGS